MKRIAFITSDMTGIGGVSTVVRRLTEELKKEYEIIFIGKNNSFSDEFKCIEYEQRKYFSNTGRVYSNFIRAVNKYSNLINKPKYNKLLRKAYFPDKALLKLKEILEKEKIDYCIATAGTNSMLLGCIAKEINTYCIGWQLNSYEAYFKNKHKYMWHQNCIFQECVSHLDQYIVLNEDDKEKILKEMEIESKVIFNPTSYESNECSNLNNKEFMAAGHLWEGKGFDLLIRSFAHFCKENDGWKLSIYGVGPDEEKLKLLSKKINVEDKVEFKGNISDTRIAFKEASIFCLSSRWEGMPMIALESIEMGVPIISYDISAIKPIVDDKNNGVIVEKYDVEKYAEAMLLLANDEKLRNEFGRRAKEKAKEFTVESIVKKWKEEFIANKEV